MLVLSSITGRAMCQNTVTIDTTVRHQTVFGWGAGLRRGTKVFYDSSPALISQVEDLCFNQLHVNIVRALCQATMEPVNDNSDPFSLDTTKLVWTSYDYTTKDIYAIQRALVVSKGRINYIFSSNNSAPPWQKTNNSITYGGSILPTMYERVYGVLQRLPSWDAKPLSYSHQRLQSFQRAGGFSVFRNSYVIADASERSRHQNAEEIGFP